MKKYLYSIVFLLAFFSASFQTVFAAGGCTYVGQCVGNKKCECSVTGPRAFQECQNADVLFVGTQDCGSAIIGGVKPPTSVQAVNDASGGIGIVYFASRLLDFGSVIAGILVMINFLVAGFIYITSAGNSAANEKVRDRISWSFVGLIVILAAYVLAGIGGLIFFGDATYILQPQLQGALN